MTDAPHGGATLGEYLQRDSPAQRRVLEFMTDGHALTKHRDELHRPARAAYQRRVADHLERASVGFTVVGGGTRTRYFVGNPRTGEAAWINPEMEDRSTYFETWQGLGEYMRHSRLSNPQDVWRPLDLRVVRNSMARSAARGVVSADRGAQAAPSLGR